MPSSGHRPGYGEGRLALLDAAIKIVSERGLRGLTVRGVSAEAGVSHGLVRHHFGTRSALLEATLKRSVELAIGASSLEPRTGRIADIAQELGGYVETDHDVLAFQYEALLEARRRADLLPHVRQMYEDFTGAVGRELDREGFHDDPELARVIFAALDGLALQQVVFGDGARTEAGVRLIQELLRESVPEDPQASD